MFRCWLVLPCDNFGSSLYGTTAWSCHACGSAGPVWAASGQMHRCFGEGGSALDLALID